MSGHAWNEAMNLRGERGGVETIDGNFVCYAKEFDFFLESYGKS